MTRRTVTYSVLGGVEDRAFELRRLPAGDTRLGCAVCDCQQDIHGCAELGARTPDPDESCLRDYNSYWESA